jgi:hypothetical protein
MTQCVLDKNSILPRDTEGSEANHTLQELNGYRFLLRPNPQWQSFLYLQIRTKVKIKYLFSHVQNILNLKYNYATISHDTSSPPTLRITTLSTALCLRWLYITWNQTDLPYKTLPPTLQHIIRTTLMLPNLTTPITCPKILVLMLLAFA